MNEIGCQRAIKKLINDNSTVLVDGLVEFGQQRRIKDIVMSVMTAPRDYYFVLVQVNQKTGSSNFTASANENKPHRKIEYTCSLHVVDVAVQSGLQGEEPYELVHEHHRVLCDRIEALICGSYYPGGGTYATYFVDYPTCIPDPESDSAFRLMRSRGNADRSVRIQNMDTMWKDPSADQPTPIFYSVLNFSMIEEWAK